MARIHGKGGQVKMDAAGGDGSAATVLADINSFTLDLTTEKVPVPAFGDPNIQYVTGLPDCKGTLGGWWSSLSSPALFEVVLGTVAPFLILIPNRLEPTYLFQGLGWLDGSIEVSATGAVSLTSNFVAAGPWEMEP